MDRTIEPFIYNLDWIVKIGLLIFWTRSIEGLSKDQSGPGHFEPSKNWTGSDWTKDQAKIITSLKMKTNLS